MKNKKLVTVLKATSSFILVLAVCASASLFFHSYYYDSVYISGNSMYPTLVGADDADLAEATDKGSNAIVDFGIVDHHASAKKHIKRFDIISTYYPTSSDYNLETMTLKKNATKKIKRVIGLPNETIRIEKGSLYVLKDNKYELVPYTFETNPSVTTGYAGKDVDKVELKDNEYWVLGDNRQASNDSGFIGKPINYDNIYGVLVAIEGQGEIYVKKLVCQNCGSTYKYMKNYGGLCDKCYGPLAREYDIKNKHYRWPTFY